MRLSEDVQMHDPGDESTFLYGLGLVVTAIASAGAGIVSSWLAFRGKIEEIRSSHQDNVVTGITTQIASEHNRMEKFYEDLMDEVGILRNQNKELIRKINELNLSNIDMKSQIVVLEREVHQLREQLKRHEDQQDNRKD